LLAYPSCETLVLLDSLVMDRVGCFFKTRRTRCDAFPRSSSTRPALCLPDVYPWFQLWVLWFSLEW